MSNVVLLPINLNLTDTHSVNLDFTGIPIPPSLNNAYPTAKSGVRIKSKELRQWERDFQSWSLIKIPQIRIAKYVMANLSPLAVLSVECIYYFRRERILCRDGRPKRLDADNRLKCLLDGITTLLGIDDARIWQGAFAKRIEAQGYESCSVSIRILESADENAA